MHLHHFILIKRPVPKTVVALLGLTFGVTKRPFNDLAQPFFEKLNSLLDSLNFLKLKTYINPG